MTKSKVDAVGLDGVHATLTAEPHDPIDDAQFDQTDIVVTAATVAASSASASPCSEVALLPGVVLGVAGDARSKPSCPSMGSGAQSFVQVHGWRRRRYKFGQKTKEMVAEAQEHVNDIVAEAKADDLTAPAAGDKTVAAASAH